MPSGNIYTEEDMIEKLKEHPDLSRREWDKEGIKPSSNTVKNRFGSWNEAKEIAGLDTHRRGSKKKEKYTKVYIIEKLKKHPNLAAKEWADKGMKPSMGVIMDRFGSWNEAREMAGLETEPVGGSPKDKEKIVREAVKEGGPMTISELKEETDTYIKLIHIDIPSIAINVSRGPGGRKYGLRSIIDLDYGTKIAYLDSVRLGEYLEEHLKFELNDRMGGGKKSSLTNFLRSLKKCGMPEETYRYLRSKYIPREEYEIGDR